MKTKNYLFIALLLCCSVSVFSQNRATIIQLSNKNWSMKFSDQKDYAFTESYTNEFVKMCYEFNGTRHESIDRYYLSENADKIFNDSSVGKIQNGRYIVTKNSRNGDISVFEIMEITDSYLKLRVLNNNSLIEFIAK